MKETWKRTLVRLGFGRRAAHGAVSAGIASHARIFDGLYDSLYQSVNRNEPDGEVYREWCQRAETASDPAFADAFRTIYPDDGLVGKALRKRCRLLLEDVYAAGISRDRDTGQVCLADADFGVRYVTETLEKPVPGRRYTVWKSAWVQKGTVMETGLALLAGPEKETGGANDA